MRRHTLVLFDLFCRRHERAFDVQVSPADEFLQDAVEIAPAGGEGVLIAQGRRGVGFFGNDAEIFQSLEPLGQDVGGDPFRGVEKLIKGFFVQVKHVADDQQCPFIPDQIKGVGDRADRTVKVAAQFFHLGCLFRHGVIIAQEL